MLRQLLTLLAVISGLTLVAEPARALDADVVSMVQASAEQGDCTVTVGPPLQLSEAGLALASTAKPCKNVAIVVVTPPVQLKADRARE